MPKETISESFLKFAREIAGDKEVKTELLSSAISGLTGIAPVVDKRNPQVTFVRLTPAHGKAMEALLKKKVMQGPSGVPVTVKLDVMPAVRPMAIRYVALPALGLFAAGLLIGKYFLTRR